MVGLPFSDDFTGTDGSAWSAVWTPRNVTGTNSIQSNRGQLNGAASNTTWTRLDLTGVTLTTNFDISFDFFVSAPVTTGTYSPLNIFVNSDGSNTTGQAPNNGYYFYFFPQTGGFNSILLYQMASGTATGLANQGWLSSGGNELYSMRIRYTSGTLSHRLWYTNDTETAAWAPYSVTLTPGSVSISMGGNASGTYYSWIDNLNIFDPTVQTTVPGKPWGVTVSEGDTLALAYCKVPKFDGGSTILTYTATVSPGNLTFTSDTLPVLMSGLTNDTPYTVTMHATNANGNSFESLPYPFSPGTISGSDTVWLSP